MKYHYSIRSNLSIGPLHDLLWNKGLKQEVLQPVTAFLEQLHLLWISITGSVSHSSMSSFIHLFIYLFIYYLNSFMCVVSRLDMCGGPSTLLTA